MIPLGGYRSQVDEIRARIDAVESETIAFGDLVAFHQLVLLEQAVRDAIARTGAGLRAGGASYGQLGAACGISKQAARKRWS